MLETPDIQDQALISALNVKYGLDIADLAFLPLGADRNTAAYRMVAADGTAYFLKLRRGVFHEASVVLPKHLGDEGVGHVVVPLETRGGRLWAYLDSFTLVLYPFIEGQDAYQIALSSSQWLELGQAMRAIHAVTLPEGLSRSIRSETYSCHWCVALRQVLVRAPKTSPVDGAMADLIGIVEVHHDEIVQLIDRTERLAQSLQAKSPSYVLCHSDIHAGNILIEPSGTFYIVDWDEPVFAPRERDLMFIGGGYWGDRQAPQAEAWFYQGYGPTQIDARALTYYRYARIIEDVALFCEHVLDAGAGLPDRQQSLKYLKADFEHGGAIEAAYAADQAILQLCYASLERLKRTQTARKV